MASVTLAGTIFDTTAGNKAVTATPALNDLIVVCAGASAASFADAATTAVTDDNASGTYTLVDEPSGANSPRMSTWVRDALIGSAVSTIFTATQATSTGGGLWVYRISGMTRVGLDAIRANGNGTTGAAGTPEVTLAQAALTTNPLIAAVINSANPAGITPPASWTEDATNGDLGYTSPNTGMQTCFIDSGFTSATVTWGSTTATASKEAALELDTSGGVAPTPTPIPRVGPDRRAGN